MKFRSTQRGLISSFGLGFCAVTVLASTATAQQQRYYPQPQGGYPQQPYNQPANPYYQQQPQGYAPPQQPTQYENPIQFLPKFGQRMSEMMRRLFYGKDATGYDYPPQGSYGQGGYSLDASPRQQSVPSYPQQSPQGYPMPGSGYGQQQVPPSYSQPQPQGYPQQPNYQYPPQQQPQSQAQNQPRYNYPPQQQPSTSSRSKSAPPAPTSSTKSSSSSSKRTYTPPKINDSAPPPKTSSKSSAPPTTTKQAPQDSPPPPQTTTRRSESTSKDFPSTSSSSSGSSGSFLKGKKTSKPGRVISPYPPYKELDITGLESGSLALDPTTQKVFEVP